jgi:HAD superfamily hydrolase (TIGR01509 family)
MPVTAPLAMARIRSLKRDGCDALSEAWMFDAVFFDLDGTLVDTESVAIRTGVDALVIEAHPPDRAFLESLVGLDGPSARSRIAAVYPDLDVERFQAHWNLAFRQDIAAFVPLKPGALEVTARLLLPMAVVTSSRRVEAHDKIDRAGLGGRFRFVVSFDDVDFAEGARPKPDPAPYLLACRQMGLAPERCLVIEDSEPGAEAAYRAGCHVIQVPDIVPAGGRWAHRVCDSLEAALRAVALI